MEDKLKSANETYKIKKDLKRLKFINDLPDILQNKLDEFSAKAANKDIKIFEKSLSYYERCREFLNMHKENVFPLYKLAFSQRNLHQNSTTYFCLSPSD